MNIEKIKNSLYESRLRAHQNHMNKLREKCFGVSDKLQHIRFSNRKLNCLRWHNNESREHILKKLDICIELKNINHAFITEAIFLNGSRADIVDLTDGVIYEVMNSETDDKFDEKVNNYPEEFRVVKVNLKQKASFFEEAF